ALYLDIVLRAIFIWMLFRQRSRRRLSWRCSLSAPRACRCSRNRSGRSSRSIRPSPARRPIIGSSRARLLRHSTTSLAVRSSWSTTYWTKWPLLLHCTPLTCYIRHSPWVCGQRDETTRVHQSAWRWRGGMAARGARTATRADAADWGADGLAGERFGRRNGARGVRPSLSDMGLVRAPEFADEYSLGDPRRSGVDASIREGTRRVTARPHSFAQHSSHRRAAARNSYHSRHFRD